MSEFSIRVQTYLVLGVMIACFSILYPKIFHPMLMNLLGLTKNKRIDEENFDPFGPERHHRARPGRNEGIIQQDQGKRGGIMSLVLPIYAIGIVLYLLYTLTRVFSSKSKTNKEKKEEFLRQYYRDFHYDVNRGKFRMSHDSSEDESENVNSSFGSKGFKMKTNDSNEDLKSNPFDWTTAYSSSSYPDIYRSAKSLPRDLEQLLMKMENQNLDNEELSRLRVRLEQTEKEMTRILNAMRSAEESLKNSSHYSNYTEENNSTYQSNENFSTDQFDSDSESMNCNYNESENQNNNNQSVVDELVVTASEGELESNEDNVSSIRHRVTSS